MTTDVAALVFSIVGPLATATALYFRGRHLARAIRVIRTNDMAHLDTRLSQIELRIARVETWMFEHQRNHSH